MRVDFALRVYDDYSGELLLNSAAVFTRQEQIFSPLRKKDGFNVFCGIGSTSLQLTITVPHFLQQKVDIDLKQLAPGFPVVDVRMYRQQAGKYQDCKWLIASAPQGSKVRAIAAESGLKVSHYETDDTKAKLTITGYATAKLAGKRFCTNEHAASSFIIGNMLSLNTYALELQDLSLIKQGDMIYRVYESVTNEQNIAVLAVDDIKEKSIIRTMYKAKEKDKWASVSSTELA